MKRVFTIIMIGLISVLLSFTNKKQEKTENQKSNKQTDFRNTTWGMTKSQVKATETAKLLISGEEAIAYETKLANLNVMLEYGFTNNKLFHAFYLVTEKHTNKNHYIDDHKKFKKLLTKKYGEPKKDVTKWKNEIYKGGQSRAMAISKGYLKYVSEWQTKDTIIGLYLQGGNNKNKIVVYIGYTSIKLNRRREKNDNEETMDDL